MSVPPHVVHRPGRVGVAAGAGERPQAMHVARNDP